MIHDLLAKAINKKRENEQERRLIDLEKSFEKERKKKRFQTMISTLLGVVSVFVIWSLFFTKIEEQDQNQDSLYQICLKAKIFESEKKNYFGGDERKYFGENDHWDVNLVFWTTKDMVDTLQLKHQINPAQLNFHKGGERGDSLILTFTKAEIDSLNEIFVEIRPKTTLCKKGSILINLHKKYIKPICFEIAKNYEETDTYEGFVHADLGNKSKPIPLNRALIVVAGKTFYTDSTGQYTISVPRGNALYNHIYVIKQGYCFVDTILRNGINIKLKRDTTQNFDQKWNEILALWELSQKNKRKKTPTQEEQIIMNKFLLDDRKNLRRGLNKENNKDTLRFVYYDLGKVRNGNNDKADCIIAKEGDIRNIIGVYKDKKERKYIFEGSMTLVNSDSAEWSLDIIQYDINFNTQNRKAILSHAYESKKTKITITK